MRPVVLALFLVGTLLASSEALFAQPDAPWYVTERTRLDEKIKQQKAREATILKNIAGAREIESAAASSNQPNAQQVAHEAVMIGERALAKLRAQIAADEAFQKAFATAARWKATGKAVAVAAMLVGAVTKDTPRGPVPFDPNMPMTIGDTIRTGRNSSVELRLEDGVSMRLQSETIMKFEDAASGILSFFMPSGRLGVRRVTAVTSVRAANDAVRVKTVSAVAAVRGTEFDLLVDEKGLTHLKPVSGVMSIEAAKPDTAKIVTWWLTAKKNDIAGVNLFSDAAANIQQETAPDGKQISVLKNGRFHLTIPPANTSEQVIYLGKFKLAAATGEFDITIDGSTVDIIPYSGLALITVRNTPKSQ